MKFWQKAFICVIALFVVGFDISAFLIVQKSYGLSLDREINAAKNEHQMIKASLGQRLLSVEDDYTEYNENNLQYLLQPYAEYYKRQEIYFQLYQNGMPVYSNFNFDTKAQLDINPGQIAYMLREIGGTPFLFVSSFLEAPFTDFQLVYIKNERAIKEYKAGIIRYCIAVFMAVSVILSAVTILMLLKLTSPFKKLRKAAREIASGNYDKRVAISSRDEIGDFALSFNTMTESVQSQIRTLSELTEAKQRFIDNLAHEMRTPITAIMGYAEVLKNADLRPGEKNMALDYIISQSERLKNMSAKLMKLADLGSSDITLEKVNLIDTIRSVERTFKATLDEKGVAVTKDVRVQILVTDKDLLETLLQNIVENSMRAVSKNGQIHIATLMKNDRTVIQISDNGIGIKASELAKISEPFYRIDKSRSRQNGGIGLGLALCNRICDVLGAKMSFSSGLGRGTTVEIEFTTVLQLDENSMT